MSETTKQLETEVAELLEALSTSFENVSSGIAEISDAIAGLNDEVEALGDFTDDAEAAAQVVAASMSDELVKEIQETSNFASGVLDVFSDLHEQIAQKITGNDGVLSEIASAKSDIQEATGELEGLAGQLADAADEAFESLEERMDSVTNSVEAALAQLENGLDEVADGMAVEIAEQIVEPLKEIVEILQATWGRIFEEQVAEVLERLFEGVLSQIKQPMEEVVGEMVDMIIGEFENLVSELVGGDTTAEGASAEMEQSLEVLKDAMDQLKPAFEAFRGLASSVGVGV